MEEFDPYSAWLGIPAGSRPPDHYQLLGLPAFQDDRNLISAAANHQLAQVKPHFGGPQASLALRLLNEIASAKELLLNPEAKASYDADLQRRQKAGPAFVPPPRKARMKDIPLLPPGFEAAPEPEAAPLAPPPVAAPAAPVASPAYAPAQVAAVPQAPAYPQAMPQAAYVPQQAMMAMPVAQPAMYGAPYQQPAPYGYPQPYGQPMQQPDPGPAFSVARSRVPTARRTSSTEMALAMLALCVLAVAGVAGFIVWRMQNPDATTEGDGSELAVNDPSNSFQRKPIIAEPKHSDSGSMQRTAMEDLYPDNYKPGSKTAKKGNAGRPNSNEGMLGIPDPRTPGMKPDEMAKVEPPKMVEPPKKVQPKPEPAKTEPKKPEPAKAKPATPPMATKAPDPKETAAVNKGLTTARTAIKNRHFKDAADQLDLLELDGPSPQSMAEIEQVRSVLHYSNEFWNGVKESWKSLVAGAEFMINDETVVVVEATPDKLIIRAAGQNREYTVEKMPAAVALALADKWFKNDPGSKAAIGVFHSTDTKGDKKKGRDLLNQAAKEGIDVASLLKEFDRK